jgi:hypothetical protein
MLCYVSWLGSPLSDSTPSARRAFFQWTNQWSIAVPSGSMESEIYAIHAATKGTAPTRGLLGEIGVHDGSATSLAVDSASSMTVLQGEHSEKNSVGVKHIDRRTLSVRQQFAAGIYAIHWVPSADNPADMGATFKSRVEYERLRTMIMGYAYPRNPLVSFLRDTEPKSHWAEKAEAKAKADALARNTIAPAAPAGEAE